MTAAPADPVVVREFRQILFWPLQLTPLPRGAGAHAHWELLRDTAWREVPDEFVDPAHFPEHRYSEFVTFLPYVQRLLYGEGGRADSGHRESPIRVYARTDVVAARVSLARGAAPIELDVVHARLYFFADVDVVIPTLELRAADLTLRQVEDVQFRFGRAYPAAWDADGSGARCPASVAWISSTGDVLAESDYDDRARYLSCVARHRAPCAARHWEWLLRPMLPEHAPGAEALRYRQLEYYRMPLMCYVSVDELRALGRADFVSLGLVTGPVGTDALPFSARSLASFEQDYCIDRYWAPHERHDWSDSRFVCTGHSLVVVARHGDAFCADPHTGLLGQFRRQYFLLGLLAHFNKAALLLLSDRLVHAISRLDVRDVESVKRFKRQIRRTHETFLRFTHRYWFHEVSTQDLRGELFRAWTRHLGTDRLYAEVREEIEDMSKYLDSDSLRRQANTVVRLTVVTTLGLIGTVATGLLGMNLIAAADEPWPLKLLYFVLTLVPATLLILYTIVRSKALSDFLETLADERLGFRDRLRAGLAAWTRPTASPRSQGSGTGNPP